MIRVNVKATFKPLDNVTVTKDSGETIRIFDGEGRLYARGKGPEFTFTVSGTLGHHTAVSYDENGIELERTSFAVDCTTKIEDDTGTFKKLCEVLRHTHTLGNACASHILSTDGEVYRMHSVASRDNVHAMKGAMYFMRHMKDGIDLHAKYQRGDGLIWDFAAPCDPELPSGHEWRWEPEFGRYSEDHQTSFGRQPAENDVEHQHIRGVWRAWKCTGDDEWMKGKLDSALKAMRFSGSSEWFWSEKYKLLKRPYTIDTWDFVSLFDRYRLPLSGDCGLAKPGVTVYGIMHGDNTGMADACDKLAEMCAFAGRAEDAKEAKAFADGLRERLDKIAWNGKFFTHHVSEDPSFERDFGVDESKQVSLSNAYALTRGIRHEQAVSIIQTYQRIREEMPETSPAEFFMIYPPFQKGWGPAASPFQYANGAVTGIVAGELARGAFEHGFESYGADILTRWLGFMDEFNGTMPWALRGAMPETPERTFETVDLRAFANADLVCEDDGVPGWYDDPGMDMRELPRGRQVMKDVPFDIIEENDKKSLLRLARGKEGFAESAEIEVDGKFKSMYFLHSGKGSPIAGEVVFKYDDGTKATKYIVSGRDVFGDWSPPQLPGRDRSIVRKDFFTTVTAWRGKCPKFRDVALFAHGMDNPEPDKHVKSVELRPGAEGASWMVIAVTLSDAPAYFAPGREAHGVPQPWAGGALSCALFEGLAGVIDTDRNMKQVRISPRWEAAGVNEVTVCLKYEDGGGYVRYSYKREGERFTLTIAGNSSSRRVELFIPQGADVKSVIVNGEEKEFETKNVENSRYVCVCLEGVGAKDVFVKC